MHAPILFTLPTNLQKRVVYRVFCATVFGFIVPGAAAAAGALGHPLLALSAVRGLYASRPPT